MNKIKITYLNYGVVKAHICNLGSYFDLPNIMSNLNIYPGSGNVMIRIETILEASEQDTTDSTQS